jgi:RNA polymerase sigma-70 factor (ECF subfamily)
MKYDADRTGGVSRPISAEQFSEIVKAYGGYVFTIAFRLLGNAADAEDAAQETFVKAYRHLDSYDETKGPKNWLCTIALNTARDFYRQSARRQSESLGEQHNSIEEGRSSTAGIADQLDAEKMLSVLDINYRSVVMLFYMEQYSIKEIAGMMKKSEAAIKVWLFRARKKIIEVYGDPAV